MPAGLKIEDPSVHQSPKRKPTIKRLPPCLGPILRNTHGNLDWFKTMSRTAGPLTMSRTGEARCKLRGITWRAVLQWCLSKLVNSFRDVSKFRRRSTRNRFFPVTVGALSKGSTNPPIQTRHLLIDTVKIYHSATRTWAS